jgi:hypothetical protein
MTQTFVGSNNNEIAPDLAQKLAQGLGGPMLMASMFESVGALLEAHGAPDAVKAAAENFKQEVLKWAEAIDAPEVVAPVNDAPKIVQTVAPGPESEPSHDNV